VRVLAQQRDDPSVVHGRQLRLWIALAERCLAQDTPPSEETIHVLLCTEWLMPLLAPTSVDYSSVVAVVLQLVSIHESKYIYNVEVLARLLAVCPSSSVALPQLIVERVCRDMRVDDALNRWEEKGRKEYAQKLSQFGAVPPLVRSVLATLLASNNPTATTVSIDAASLLALRLLQCVDHILESDDAAADERRAEMSPLAHSGALRVIEGT
jgi:hypothetical protein